VVGKGQRLREVPVPSPVVRELQDYLASHGLDLDPTHPVTAQAFLLGLPSDAPSARRSYRRAPSKRPRALCLTRSTTTSRPTSAIAPECLRRMATPAARSA
jgi:phytoene dehydrogenase-like protein